MSDFAMSKDLAIILNYLKEKRGFDFSGYRNPMVARRVQQRFPSIKCETYSDYFNYLQENPDELDNLLDVLTINVSRFFRDTLTFEYIADRVLPALTPSSANCSYFSIACFRTNPHALAGTTKHENGIQESGVRIQNEERGDIPSAC